jgi:hypothetical protein
MWDGGQLMDLDRKLDGWDYVIMGCVVLAIFIGLVALGFGYAWLIGSWAP